MAWMSGLGRACNRTTNTTFGTLYKTSPASFPQPQASKLFPIDQLTLGQDTLPRETSKEVIDGPAGLAGS